MGRKVARFNMMKSGWPWLANGSQNRTSTRKKKVQQFAKKH
jgi:hypothetical protein